ncbi:hypothetical protein PR048_007397 [Dryococelus australis]|uniref:Protein kinase domain-containing protein n=1 Tax=Dryococelus australis TaxID=614101 RepID=A0ABQ9HU52_9NEOP|nr:hypothetical protein PR048_007397 [Dryococelus australis]
MRQVCEAMSSGSDNNNKVCRLASVRAVHLCTRLADEKPVVIKCIPLEQVVEKDLADARNEVKVLSMLTHPNIIEYYDSFHCDGVFNIVMEYASGGTLHEFITSRDGCFLPQKDVLHLFCQLVLAVHHIHSHRILHRDLKTANIFLSGHSPCIVKVGDFGISKVLSSQSSASTVLGTPCYMSPELCQGRSYNTKSDIWALGCVLYELIALHKAFHAPEKQEFVEVTVKMFLKANIPLNKLDDSAIHSWLWRPSKSSHSTTNVVPRVGETMQEAIKDKKMAVVADETTIICGRCVFAVLFGTVTARSAQNVQVILATVNKFDISFDNLLDIVSDSAHYMGTCFLALQTIFGGLLLKEFEELYLFVAKMKSAFLHSRKIKNASLFPVPVVTCWNSWFNSELYLAQYIEGILKFFSNECEFTNSSIEYIVDMFKFVSEICMKIKALITDLEGSDYPYAHKLQNSLQRYAGGSFPHGTIQLLNQSSNAAVKEGKQLLSHVEEGDIQLLLAVRLKYPEFTEAALRCHGPAMATP